MKKLISVIIVNWNGKHHLPTCLHALSNQTYPDFEVILVDNGSEDGSVEYVSKHHPHIRTIKLQRNTGFCGGNNIGYLHAKGEFIALLNNDTKVKPDWLHELVRGMESDPDIGICASCMVNYFDPKRIDTVGDGYDFCGVGFKIGNGEDKESHQKPKYTFGACAGAAMYRRTMIERVGLFDESLFAVGEDIDLSFRAKIAGYKCLYVPKAVVYHKVNQTVGVKSGFLHYYSRRNIEHVYFKNMPLNLLMITFPMHLIYNCMAFIDSVLRRQVLIFGAAKLDFLRNLKLVARKRKKVQQLRAISTAQLLKEFSFGYLIVKIKEFF